MTKLTTQPYRGMRDFYPEDQRIQNYIFEIWTKTCQSFGYEQYNAPTIEPTELYAGKTSDEIVNEQTYTFTDRGNRSVTLRTEMTPSVARMVAARVQELSYPLRWYSIPNCFRYERPQKGRLREFWQLNVDLFGAATIYGEIEMIKMANEIMQAFGATNDMYRIKINSRILVNLIMSDWLELNTQQSVAMIRLLDRKDKIPEVEFLTQSRQITGSDLMTEKITQLLKVQALADLPDIVANNDAVKEIRLLFDLLAENGLQDNVVFEVGLMRGLDYYTDIVFEIYDTDPENNRSIFGGGRYDGLMSVFGAQQIPSIGFGMGDASILNFLISHNLLPEFKVTTDVYVVIIGDSFKDAQNVAQQLRQSGVNVAVDLSGKKADKQIKTAIKQGVPYILFIGEEEIKTQQYKLKDTKTQDEQTLGLEEIVERIIK